MKETDKKIAFFNDVETIFKLRTNDMSNRFKSTLLWTFYIALVIVGVFTIILLGVNVLAPTIMPETDISGIKEYINTFCVILSFYLLAWGFIPYGRLMEVGNKQMKF